MNNLLINNIISNAIPLFLLAALLWAVVRAGRVPLWAEAYRRLRCNPVALVALSVIGVYCLVALLDSVGWQADNNSNYVTVIDRIFTRPKERTYSAPLARETFGEPRPRALQSTSHLFGTDGTGNDVFYRTLKGCRTAIIIGGLTQLLVTPIALLMGMLAGYFGKVIDDVVQYVYTVLDSIPQILLLIALIIALGPGLLNLCIALGITSWVGLCRLIRGETLKHRDREYVRSARALGVPNVQILTRHILPNLLPIVIIQVTLGVSGLVLSEAILSYLQVGVGPGVGSWGNMVDAARIELAREPIIWWNLAAASTAVFLLVLAFNLFGDALRDAVDPRLRSG